MVRVKTFFVVVSCCLLASKAMGRTLVVDTLTSRTHSLGNVEVVSRRVPTNVKSAVQLQNMPRERIDALGISAFSDVVKMMAGVNVRDYGGIGGLKTVSIHNLGAQHTSVSYDGITIGDSQAGQIDIGQLSLDNVRLVSLAMGQDNNIMRTAREQASAGVLYIESERPSFEYGGSVFRFGLRGGSFGLVNPSLRYWQRMSNNTSLSINANLTRADGTYPFLLANGNLITHEKRHNSDVLSYHAEANLYHTFNDSSEIEVKAYYYHSRRGLPGAVILYNNTSNERMWNENFFAQASYHKVFPEAWDLRAHIKYNHAWDKYKDVGESYAGGEQTDIDRQDEYYSSVVAGFTPLNNLSFTLAQDMFINKLRNNIDEMPNPLRLTSLTSLSVKYQILGLTVVGNLLNTLVTEHISVDATPPNRSRLSPSLSLSYRLLRDHSLYIRMMYKSTFRVPTFNDLYYRRMGNTKLRPENAHEYSAGLTWGSGNILFFDNITITADAYYNDVTDKIVAFPSTYVWRMANFGKVHVKGLDITLATTIPLNNKINLDINASYTLQKAVDLTDKAAASYGVQLPYTPENSGSVSIVVRNPWVNVAYSIIASGKTWSQVQHEPEYIVGAYAEHSISLSRDFKLKGGVIRLQGTLHNILNTQYEIIKYYPMPRRNYEISGNITF